MPAFSKGLHRQIAQLPAETGKKLCFVAAATKRCMASLRKPGINICCFSCCQAKLLALALFRADQPVQQIIPSEPIKKRQCLARYFRA